MAITEPHEAPREMVYTICPDNYFSAHREQELSEEVEKLRRELKAAHSEIHRLRNSGKR